MVALVEESKAVGIDTMDELVYLRKASKTTTYRTYEAKTTPYSFSLLLLLTFQVRQGEQLDHIENNLDDIAFGIGKAENNLDEMNKCCGLFTLPWKRWKKFDRTAAYKDAYDAKRVAKREKAAAEEAEKAAAATQRPTAKGATQQQQGPYVQRVMNDSREDEMEDNLKAVADGMEMLKGMALDFGATIDKQNAQIDNITAKGEANEIGLAQNQHRMDRMLKGM